MRIASGRRLFGHYARRIVAASLLVAAAACATGSGAVEAWSNRPSVNRTLTFENSTTEPVTLYLVERGTQWFVGYVGPGMTASLALPWATSRPPGREFSLVAVPSTARRSATTTSTVSAGPIRMEQLPSDYLTSVRWKLTGRWLIALPPPTSR